MRTHRFAPQLPLALPLSLLLLVAACSDEDSKKPCPAQGLGVVSAGGKSCVGLSASDPELADCQAQLENHRDYACTEPQLCPDRTIERSTFVIASDAAAYGMSFIIGNCSTGNKKLTISKIDFLGDAQCHFMFDFTTDVQQPELGPGEQTLVQARYLPTQPGTDHAVMVVHSNAQNFPELRLFACGTGVPKYPSGQDSGSPQWPDIGVMNDAGFSGLACKDQTQVAACHQ